MIIDAAPLAAFAFATSITPGPNNLMLMSSGARFGLRRTTPHMLGVTIGFGVIAIAAGLGLARALEAEPSLRFVMTGVAAGFMLYLAWRLATAPDTGALGAEEAEGRPLSFLEAALFQWVNPKTWAMALSAMTLYTPEEPSLGVILAAAAVFCAVNLPCVGVWAAAGVRLVGLLRAPGQRRVFNRVMAALLALSVAPMLG